MSYDEKDDITHLEKNHGVQDSSIPEDNTHGTDVDVNRDIDHGFDPALVKRVMRKVDFRLIPVLSALYCISLIDRTNLSQAREANQRQMDKDLGFGTGNGYSLATLIFFVPYVSFLVFALAGSRGFCLFLFYRSQVGAN
jgi:hypothetical protein